MTVLVAYASKHGSTEGIAQAIADRLSELGVSAEARSVDEVGDLGDRQAVVLGSAVYAGSWMKDAVEFAHRHAEPLAERPVWLFSSGPLGDEVEDEEEQPRQLSELRGLLGPIDHKVFFGALDRSKLGFGERMLVKAVKAPDGDFRDWEAIRSWADGIAAELGEVGLARSARWRPRSPGTGAVRPSPAVPRRGIVCVREGERCQEIS